MKDIKATLISLFAPIIVAVLISLLLTDLFIIIGSAPYMLLPPCCPSPSDGAKDQAINQMFQWTTDRDPGVEIVTHILYLDTNPNPTEQAYQGTSNSFYKSGLNYDTTYYWRVTASFEKGPPQYGPVWSFTTEKKPNRDPIVPNSPVPRDAEVDIPRNDLTLSWNGGDPDGDTVTYTVYLDSSSNPTTQKCQGTKSSCSISSLSYSTKYYWRVVASDGKAPLVNSPVWSFTTLVPLGPTPAPEEPIGTKNETPRQPDTKVVPLEPTPAPKETIGNNNSVPPGGIILTRILSIDTVVGALAAIIVAIIGYLATKKK